MENVSLRKIEFKITETTAGNRLDKALTLCPEIVSRSQASKLISRGAVHLNGTSLKASYITRMGDALEIFIPEQESSDLAPYDFPLNILHEDEDIIVVNKPAGLVVHPANGHLNDTLVNALIHHTRDLSLGFQENRPGLIHRLDRDTSGVLVVAKNELAQTRLAKQFQKKTAKRRYWAIVYGEFKASQGTITTSLARHPSDRKRFASVKDDVNFEKGKKAITHFKVKSSQSGLSLLELKLETGRTHQIRIHLSENHHSIVGDEVYGNKSRAHSLKAMSLRQVILNLNRFALHAFELGFVHPRSLQWMDFFAPWPNDLEALAERSQLSIPAEPGKWEVY